MLLMERFAFTQRDVFNRLRATQPSIRTLALAHRLIFNPIETMATLASQHCIHVHDWHSGNIAFKEEWPLSMVLIDWTHNVPYEGPPKKRYMKAAFQAYLKNMSDVDLDELGIARNVAFVNQWQFFMEAFKTKCDEWWRKLHQLPTREDLEHLQAVLLEVCDSVPQAQSDDGAQYITVDAPTLQGPMTARKQVEHQKRKLAARLANPDGTKLRKLTYS